MWEIFAKMIFKVYLWKHNFKYKSPLFSNLSIILIYFKLQLIESKIGYPDFLYDEEEMNERYKDVKLCMVVFIYRFNLSFLSINFCIFVE